VGPRVGVDATWALAVEGYVGPELASKATWALELVWMPRGPLSWCGCYVGPSCGRPRGPLSWCGCYVGPRAEFEILTAVTTNRGVFWDVMLCSQAEVRQRFGGAYCLHLQG
jgi:hypothetical protein